MIITYSKDYIRKSSVPGYPMKGYWIQLGSKISPATRSIYSMAEDPESDTLVNFQLYFQWNGHSNLIACNTFLYPNKKELKIEKDSDGNITREYYEYKDNCRISFDITDANDVMNNRNIIYLFALDLLVDDDITKLGNNSIQLFKHLAGIIEFDDDEVIDPYVTNIIDLGYYPKCAFNTNAGTGMNQVEHYNSTKMGQSNYLDESLMDGQLIRQSSVEPKIRQSMTYDSPHQLLGSMTIRKSGLIQL